ncbi:Transposable element tc3 transposase [Penicillium waksmanii]|uniref:Transposable element tc3 transposase n=1 Tax=Penicillium waksmanii TaxID=69791 RepID=UPI0025490FE3|nr:Transposable element tc3 transposase [Penicillium waksmanii]KAJ6000060.1 Transposable element tc3 transposase [Penicillium waksmanii]
MLVFTVSRRRSFIRAWWFNRFVIEELYRRILLTLLPTGDGTFMPDNAPTYTAYFVRDALEEIKIEVMIWPPYSPDANPIENFWDLLEAYIYKIRPDLTHMKNNDETKRILHKLHGKYRYAPSETPLRLLPHRMQAIIEPEGWYMPY